MPMHPNQERSYVISFDDLNVELLARVRDAIVADPAKFDMAAVIHSTDDDLDYAMWTEFHATDLTHGCDTAACIAGWALALSTAPGTTVGSVRHRDENWMTAFGRLSGMQTHPDDLTIPLCFREEWPSWAAPSGAGFFSNNSGIIISLDEHDTAVLLLDLILDRRNPWHMTGLEVMAWRAARLVP